MHENLQSSSKTTQASPDVKPSESTDSTLQTRRSPIKLAILKDDSKKHFNALKTGKRLLSLELESSKPQLNLVFDAHEIEKPSHNKLLYDEDTEMTPGQKELLARYDRAEEFLDQQRVSIIEPLEESRKFSILKSYSDPGKLLEFKPLILADGISLKKVTDSKLIKRRALFEGDKKKGALPFASFLLPTKFKNTDAIFPNNEPN